VTVEWRTGRGCPCLIDTSVHDALLSRADLFPLPLPHTLITLVQIVMEVLAEMLSGPSKGRKKGRGGKSKSARGGFGSQRRPANALQARMIVRFFLAMWFITYCGAVVCISLLSVEKE
jgi:hypothetical protein